METLILFDQDTQHYRQSIYRYFAKVFAAQGYNLKVVYDKNLNSIDCKNDLFIGADYSLLPLIRVINKFKCRIIIQFIWMRYKFLLPFMLYNKVTGVKIILWSHGINLQNKNQIIKNILYYTRQYLADALIIYTPDQRKYIKASHKKLFVANNTLNFGAFPNIIDTKEMLKSNAGLSDKKLIISIARFGLNNRKIHHLVELAQKLGENYHIIIVGSGLADKDVKQLNKTKNIENKGSNYDEVTICKLYKMADLFVMPGAIGLAINQALFYETPVIIENTVHGPEEYYLEENYNGLKYQDVEDLYLKTKYILDPINYKKFKDCTQKTIKLKASIEKMTSGFVRAINYVEKK